jgi:hypothetical protein
MVIAGDATTVGLAIPEMEGPLVGPGAKLELWHLRSLRGEVTK